MLGVWNLEFGSIFSWYFAIRYEVFPAEKYKIQIRSSVGIRDIVYVDTRLSSSIPLPCYSSRDKSYLFIFFHSCTPSPSRRRYLCLTLFSVSFGVYECCYVRIESSGTQKTSPATSITRSSIRV